MLVHSDVSLTRGLRSIFISAMMQQQNWVDQIATVVESDGALETYGWMGQVPQMREFLSRRVAASMTDTSYALTNKKFEATIAVKRDDIADDKLGALPIRISQLAARAANHANKMLVEALVNGTSSTLGLCYDGTAFFGDSHTARGSSGTQDNKLAGSGTTASALSTDFAAAVAQMRGFADEAGEPFNEDLGSLVVVAPPALEIAFKTMLNAAIISQTQNVLVGSAQLLISGRLSDANDWYLLHTGGPLRPLIMQDREPVEFVALEDGERAFTEEVYLYGVRARRVVGYGFWQDAIKTTN